MVLVMKLVACLTNFGVFYVNILFGNVAMKSSFLNSSVHIEHQNKTLEKILKISGDVFYYC